MLRGVEGKNFYFIAISHADNQADGAVPEVLYDPYVMGTGIKRLLRMIKEDQSGFEPLVYEAESGEVL